MSAEYGMYYNGTRVLVAAPGDPYTGKVGTVTETFNDAGEIVHRVQFCVERGYPVGDHHTAYYTFDELRRAARQKQKD